MVLLAYNLQIQKTSCLKIRSSAMVPIKQLHVKLLLYAEGKKKQPKNTLAKIMPVLLAPLSSKYILIIETSFSKALRLISGSQAGGHMRQGGTN